MTEEKPQYGWFVKNLIVGLTIMGLIGLALIFLAFFFELWYKNLLLIIGIIMIVLFLWPGLGMSVMNIILNIDKSPEIDIDPLNINKSPIILDVGCGTGRTAIKIAKHLKNGGHLHGIDIYSKGAIGGNSLETVQRNASIEGVDHETTFQHGSATEIPFDDEFFDIVNFSSVLHELHMQNGRVDALKEAYRVLKPGGYLHVGEWNRNAWQLILYCGIFCFVFKKYNYWLDLLKKHDFVIQKQKILSGFYVFSALKPMNKKK